MIHGKKRKDGHIFYDFFLDLVKKKDFIQNSKVAQIFLNTREYVADQHITSQNYKIANARYKYFKEELLGKNHGNVDLPFFYSTIKERIVSFYKNIIRPRTYFYFLLRLFNEFIA